jgi:hypothetical protein
MYRKLILPLVAVAALVGSLSMFFFRRTAHTVDLSECLEQSCPIVFRMSDVSRMIDRGDFTAALDESLQIEEILKNQESLKMVQPGAITRILNRKRIAELYHSLSLFQEEAEGWQSLEELLAHSSQVDLEAQSLIEEGFKERNLDLKAYVATRKKEALLKH